MASRPAASPPSMRAPSFGRVVPCSTGSTSSRKFYQRPAWDGLARLAGMIAAGTLRPHISCKASWSEIGTVAQEFLDRRIAGKAVLHVR